MEWKGVNGEDEVGRVEVDGVEVGGGARWKGREGNVGVAGPRRVSSWIFPRRKETEETGNGKAGNVRWPDSMLESCK